MLLNDLSNTLCKQQSLGFTYLLNKTNLVHLMEKKKVHVGRKTCILDIYNNFSLSTTQQDLFRPRDFPSNL